MLELLVDKNKLQKSAPPRMNIGEYWHFSQIENIFGIGQQAIHNSGSTMMKDTPNFKENVLKFLRKHMAYSAEKISEIGIQTEEQFFEEQKQYFLRFKNDKEYRIKCLKKIFTSPFIFSTEIDVEYLFITLILYFIKNYNYFCSNQLSHELTKELATEIFKNETNLLTQVYNKMMTEEKIGYLSDVCYGRYYFLEVHFENRNSDGEIRNTPLSIIREFFESVLAKDIMVLSIEEIDNENEQKKINQSKGYIEDSDIELANTREPELAGTVLKKYKTDPRLAKTVLRICDFKCQCNENHSSFITLKNEEYMEAHHLIPMAFQKNYNFNIDRIENIICLCPNCHKAIHYGSKDEKEKRLRILLTIKKKQLLDIGIDIELEKLIKLY